MCRGFTKTDSDNKSFQKAVLREAKRMDGYYDRIPPSVLAIEGKSISSISAELDQTTVEKAVAANAEIRPKKVTRDAPHQANARRANWMIEKERHAAAHMLATRMHADEPSKPKGVRQSARQVIASVMQGFPKLQTSLKVRTIQTHVKEGRIGVPPAWKGPSPAELPENTFNVLVKAFESYLQTQQFNEDTEKRQFAELLRAVQLVLQPLNKPGISIVYQLLKHTSIDFSLKQANVVEQRRSAWSTCENLDMWFNNWRDFPEEMGFGKTIRRGRHETNTIEEDFDAETVDADDEGEEEFVTEDAQLHRIINIDESCLSLNGATQRRGGRPSQVVSDGKMQLGCLRTSKSSVTVTIVCGSSAAGDPVPPHFQFTSTADAENMKMKIDIVEHLPNIHAKFGHDDVTEFTPTVAGNKKGGVDNQAFEICINKNIRAPHPDVCDAPGKRVIVKVDGGAGRLNGKLLATLAADGIRMCPSLVNNTHVSQETDQSYGLFKSVFAANLHKINTDRLRLGKGNSFPWTIVGLLCFGGTDRETGLSCRNAHGEAFSVEKNKWAWRKVGAAPLTRACLSDPRIRHASVDDPKHALFRRVEEANKNACELLDRFNLRGKHLPAKLKERETIEIEETEPGTLARAKSLYVAKGHGQRCIASRGGCAFNCKDMMVAMEMGNRRMIVADMEKDKKRRDDYQAVQNKALRLLESEVPASKYRHSDFDVLFEWKGISFADSSKKTKAKQLKKDKKHELWMEVKDKPPLGLKKWSMEEEEKLTKLKDEVKETSLEETEVGRAKDRKIPKLIEEYGIEALVEKARVLHEEASEVSTASTEVSSMAESSEESREVGSLPAESQLLEQIQHAPMQNSNVISQEL